MRKITASTKIPKNEREIRVWQNTIDNLIDKVGEDAFARALYERTKDKREQFAGSEVAQKFFAMMDERMLKEERGFE